MLSLEGKQLGNYDVIRRIRVGGMGAVYEGSQRTAFDRHVAIKVILGNYAADKDMRRRFAREARTIARLHHPHILPLIEFGDEQGILYLVMPFIEGGTLTSYLRRSFPDLSEVAAIYQQLLDAVEYAHDEGLIHRDIKSSNVLLEMRRSGPPYAYLADFGLVRTSRQAEMEQAGKPIPLDQVPGTPHYMAPEQTRGIVTTLTDIYAMGVLLYQMLTGELPYNDDDDIRVIEMHLHDPIPSPCDRDASLPHELGDVVRKAMAKRPEDRFKNIAELRTAFLAALNGPVVSIQEDELPLSIEQAERNYVSPRRPASTPLIEDVPNLPKRSASLHLPTPLEPERFPVHPASPSLTEMNVASPPSPVASPRRLRNAGNVAPASTVVRDRDRQRITESVRNKQRITEEPVKRKRKKSHLPLLTATIVPVVLLILLIMPRVLGVSFFPSGFPVFGTPPVASVYVTVQSKTIQDKYVLTASSSVLAPDLTAHTIPARILKNVLSGSQTVQTSGTKSIAGIQARGTLVFKNTSGNAISVPAQFVLTTASNIQVQTTQAIQVPPHQNDQDGMATVSAVAVLSGSAGNIAAHTLDGTCCNNGVVVRNPGPFVGGTDAQTLPVVAQSDLDGVKNALAPKLQSQLLQQFQHSLGTDEVLAGQPNYTIAVSSDSPVGTQTSQVQVAINVSATAISYNTNIAAHTAAQLLVREATQTLGNTYQLQGTPIVAPAIVVQQKTDGNLYLSISAHGIWSYLFTPEQLNQWRLTIKGATSPAALAYITAQTGVASVQIQLPFGADHLPASIDDIKIILVTT